MADTDPESAAIDPELAARLYDLADDAMVDNDAVDWFGLFERNKPQIPDENARQRYCRTFMFVQVLFRRFPGTLEFDEVRAMAADLNANPIAGGANASAAEMDAFLAPNGAPDREPRDQRQVQPPPQGQLAIHPQPVGLVGGGLLEWHCRWVLRGQFNWATGASDPFRTWLNDNAAAAVATMTTLSASSTICCWEAVFYALIKTGCMPIGPVRDAYVRAMANGTAVADECFIMLTKVLAAMVPPRTMQEIFMNNAGYNQTQLRVGDIILVPSTEEPLDSIAKKPGAGGDCMHHVAVVVANTPVSANVEDTEVFHLWGKLGSVFADVTRLSTLLANLSAAHGNSPRWILARML